MSTIICPYCGTTTQNLKFVILTILKCTIQWCLVHPKCCVTTTSIWLQGILISTGKPMPTEKPSLPRRQHYALRPYGFAYFGHFI